MKQKNELLLGLSAGITADDSDCEGRKDVTEHQYAEKDALGQLESSAVAELRQDLALNGVTPQAITPKGLVWVSKLWAYWD